MAPELPDRQRRNSGRPQSHTQSLDGRSGTWPSLPSHAGKALRVGLQGKTIRAVTQEASIDSSSMVGARRTYASTSDPVSPASIGQGGLERQGHAPATSFYHAPEDVKIRSKSQQFHGNKKSSDEMSYSSQTSLISKSRVRLNSITASPPFSTKQPVDPSNSIGYPSIIPSPTLSHHSGGTNAGGRKLQRLAKTVPPTASADLPRNVQAMDIRSPSLKADANTMLSLMKTTYGRMHGFLFFRPAHSKNWSSGYCAINVASGSLIHQAKGEPALDKTLVPDLRGCRIRTLYDADDECNYLSVSTASSGLRLNLWPPVPETFESWLAALLCWQPIRPKGAQNKSTKPQAISMTDRRASDKIRASENSAPRSPAIVKVGKILLREGCAETELSRPAARRRVSTYKQLRALSPLWQRVSCTLLENGHFKLLTESDAQLILTIHLSSLSRCAIQQLHPSVLEDEYCIAIYPQYVSQPHDEIQSKPIYLSLESRVLFEVWFVLLRASTVPELYSPGKVMAGSRGDGRDRWRNTPSSLNQGLIRVERSMSLKITEAKLGPRTVDEKAPLGAYQGSETAGLGLDDKLYAEILLDGESRGRTAARPGNDMFWAEEFSFSDLPPVVSSTSVLLKARKSDKRGWTAGAANTHNLPNFSDEIITADEKLEGSSHETVLGSVELRLDDLEHGCDIDRRWPILDGTDTRVGHALMKLCLTETVVLMKEDYSPLLDLLRSFSNGLSGALAKIIPAQLKQLSEILLDIFQVSGDAAEWLTTLVEEEIDGVQDSSVQRLRYNNRIHSTESYRSPEDREIVVRDLGRSATLEANLLFRGNTLLTKALDAHMRRLGREYLEDTVGERIRDIDESNPDCEVDPSKVKNPQDLNRNWGNLITLTMNLWTAIATSAPRCPTELRQIFRHIKSCAETRYGDFLRTVAYNSVSGFLFLRFFCPAILNPKIFGLLKDNPRPRAQRTLTLIAKSLQGLANMSTFGAKEPWMEPMNKFLHASRPEFKALVDKICRIPSERSSQAVSASYATPIQILGRLSPASREGFASLPFLIDSPKRFADLVSLWVRKRPTTLDPRFESDPTVRKFHDLCIGIHQRTVDCMSNAESAERPSKGLESQWEHLLEEREKAATFYEDSASVPPTPVGDIVPEFYRAEDPPIFQPNGFSTIPLPSPGVAEASASRESTTLGISVAVPGDHSWPPHPRTRPSRHTVSTRSSGNSSVPSLELVGTHQQQPRTGERDGLSGNRLIKDFVGDTTRRRVWQRAEEARYRSGEHDGF